MATTEKPEPIVGIDLGTTNSLVAYFDDQGPRTLEDDQGRAILPSVVRFEMGEREVRHVVGHDAAERAVEFPAHTVSSVKRLMGRSLADAAPDLPYLSYRVVEGEHDTARVEIPGEGGARIVSPQEVSAIILRALASRAGVVLGTPVRKAVVTVPAYFDDAQRQATRDAGRLAGLDVVRIVNEPTAAALAYGLGLGEKRDPRTVVVFDLGGGTFDVSVLRITPNEEDAEQPAFYQVLSTSGDTRLGGDDVDHALVRLFAERMREQMGVGQQPHASSRLRSEPPAQAGETGGAGPGDAGSDSPVRAEDSDAGRPPSSETDADPLAGLDASTRKALVQFARAVKHRLSDEERATIRIDVAGRGVFESTVTRDELDAMMAGWVDRAIRCCERAIEDAGRPEIDSVIMVGGSTRIPLVRRRVAECFGVEPYTALDPDRVVALGAAVQAGIMSGRTRGALLLDVIPLSLGIETAGGAVAKLVMANSTVPARATERFTTSVDGQTSIKINVVQGEREMVGDCRSLGVFELKGLPPMPAGVPQLEVEFLVDAGGVLHVNASEARTGKRAQLQVVPNHGLTREEVDRIEADSLTHARDDMQRHRVADLVVNCKLDLKWIGEQLERHRDVLETTYRESLDAQIDALRDMVASAESDWRDADPDAMHDAKEALDQASIRLQEVAITASLRDEA